MGWWNKARQRALLGGALLVLCGCGHKAGLSTAIDASRKALHVVPTAADASAQIWAEQVDARIAHCRSQQIADEAARAQCMGAFGAGAAWEADFAELVEAYDAAADALEALANAAARIEARVRGQKVKETDGRGE